MKVHYAYNIFSNVACGIPFSSKINPHILLYTTFRKRKVTCKNCQKTVLFKTKGHVRGIPRGSKTR